MNGFSSSELAEEDFMTKFYCPMPHFTGNYSSWWNSQDQQFSQSLSKTISFRVEYSPQRSQEVGHLGLQLQDKSSPSTQSSSQSPYKWTVTGKENSQDLCVSSESVQTKSYQKHVEEQVKSAFLLSNLEVSVNPSQIDMNPSTAQISFTAYSDPCFNSVINAYGPHAIIQPQMVGIAPTRIPLPPDLAQDGPIYVNAKQYRGILRRRQMRAKLEAQNKLVKNRKPYLHESRHLHAVNRVRGSGGRFLSKKQQLSVNYTPTSDSASSSIHSQKRINMPRTEIQQSNARGHDASTTTSSTVIGHTNSNLIVQQQPDKSVSSVSSQKAVSMPLAGGFMGNDHQHRTPSFR